MKDGFLLAYSKLEVSQDPRKSVAFVASEKCIKTHHEYDARPLTLFRIGFFWAAHRWEGQNAPLPKICHTYCIMMKLGTVIPYSKKIQKIYESRDTPLEFC